MRISKKTFFWKRFHPLCIILKSDVFQVNSFVLYWKMRIYKKLFSEKDSILYVLYWKMMYFKSILLFCIKKWGMRISKNSFLNKICILMYYIEKWCFWSQFFCFVLKNEEWGKNSFVKKFCILMYYIEKWCFLSQFFCFVLKNEEWEFLKTLFRKNVTFLCIILKNEVFEVNSFVLYWKMRISKNSLWKNYILMYYIEKWCFRSQFFCFVLKNEEWGFLKTLSEKMLHSYVLYWKMRFLKSILLFYIEKW